MPLAIVDICLYDTDSVLFSNLSGGLDRTRIMRHVTRNSPRPDVKYQLRVNTNRVQACDGRAEDGDDDENRNLHAGSAQ